MRPPATNFRTDNTLPFVWPHTLKMNGTAVSLPQKHSNRLPRMTFSASKSRFSISDSSNLGHYLVCSQFPSGPSFFPSILSRHPQAWGYPDSQHQTTRRLCDGTGPQPPSPHSTDITEARLASLAECGTRDAGIGALAGFKSISPQPQPPSGWSGTR